MNLTRNVHLSCSMGKEKNIDHRCYIDILGIGTDWFTINWQIEKNNIIMSNIKNIINIKRKKYI